MGANERSTENLKYERTLKNPLKFKSSRFQDSRLKLGILSDLLFSRHVPLNSSQNAERTLSFPLILTVLHRTQNREERKEKEVEEHILISVQFTFFQLTAAHEEQNSETVTNVRSNY